MVYGRKGRLDSDDLENVDPVDRLEYERLDELIRTLPRGSQQRRDAIDQLAALRRRLGLPNR